MSETSKQSEKSTLDGSVIKKLRLLEPKIPMQKVADWLGVTKAHVGKWGYGEVSMRRTAMFLFLDTMLNQRTGMQALLENLLDDAHEWDKPHFEQRLKMYRAVINEAIQAAPDDYKEKRGFKKEEDPGGKGKDKKVRWSVPDLISPPHITEAVDALTKQFFEAESALQKLNALDGIQNLITKESSTFLNPIKVNLDSPWTGLFGPVTSSSPSFIGSGGGSGNTTLMRGYDSSSRQMELKKEVTALKTEILKKEELSKAKIAALEIEQDRQKFQYDSRIARLEDQLKAKDIMIASLEERVADKEELIFELRERIKGMDEVISELRGRIVDLKKTS